MADPDGMDRPDVNMDALKSEIRRQLINQKVGGRRQHSDEGVQSLHLSAN